MKNLTKFSIFALAFTPLIYDKHVFFPFESPKGLFVAFWMMIAGVLVLIQFFRDEEFKREILQKGSQLIKNPLVISVFSFILIYFVSVLFSLDMNSAFWGTVNRGEGLVGIVTIFSFFVFSIFIFERKDWLLFFKIILVISLLVVSKEFVEFFSNGNRPGSFMGNSAFLAGYLLFPISAAVLIFKESKEKFWKFFSIFIFTFSVVGIFLTGTRGTILGLFFGILAVLLLSLFQGKNIYYKKISLRKLSVVILSLLFVFLIIFVPSRKSEFWQNIPGINRIANIGDTDATTQSRLLAWKIGLRSVAIKNEGIKKFLIGWGPENVTIAFGKYYSPELYKFEQDSLDRAHNRLVDALVMTGLLGLCVYLAIWFFFIGSILKGKEPFLIKSGLLLLSVSFFTHLFFLFDIPVTSVLFFSFMAFSTLLSDEEKKSEIEKYKAKSYMFGVIFLLITLFLFYSAIKQTLPGYFDMRKYTSLILKKDPVFILNNIEPSLYPITIAQREIRTHFLLQAIKMENNSVDRSIVRKFTDRAIAAGEEYIQNHPEDFKFLGTIVMAYNSKGDLESALKSEKYAREALQWNPDSLEFNYSLAINLLYQKRYSEALDVIKNILSKSEGIDKSHYYYGHILFSAGEKNYKESLIQMERSFEINPDLYFESQVINEHIYTTLFKYLYDLRDKKNLFIVSDRLIKNNYADQEPLKKILEYVNKNQWPKVEFE